KTAPDHAGSFQPIEVGHADVHDDQVRMKLVGLFHGILSIHCFAANLAVLSCREQRANTPADYLMIVRDQNPHYAPPSSNACKNSLFILSNQMKLCGD